MAKSSKFGAENFRPHQLGPEPAVPAGSPEPIITAEPARPESPPLASRKPARETRSADADKLRTVRVQVSTRMTYAAEQQLKALARENDRHQTELLAEALNLLFKKHGLDEVA